VVESAGGKLRWERNICHCYMLFIYTSVMLPDDVHKFMEEGGYLPVIAKFIWHELDLEFTSWCSVLHHNILPVDLWFQIYGFRSMIQIFTE